MFSSHASTTQFHLVCKKILFSQWLHLPTGNRKAQKQTQETGCSTVCAIRQLKHGMGFKKEHPKRFPASLERCIPQPRLPSSAQPHISRSVSESPLKLLFRSVVRDQHGKDNRNPKHCSSEQPTPYLFLWLVTTLSTPKKYAERSSAPRFMGS